MKRPAEPSAEEPETKRLEIEVVEEDDLFVWVPQDIVSFHIAPSMTAASILVMSMTSKKNYALFRGLFARFYTNKHHYFTEELFHEAKDGAATSEFHMMKHVVPKIWLTSTDCLERFRLRHLCHATIAKASNTTTFASPYPIFFAMEHEIPYIQVLGSAGLGWSAILHRAYNHFTFNADLLMNLPVPVIKTLTEGDRSFLDETHGNKCYTLVHCTQLVKEVIEAGLLGYFMHGEDGLFRRLLQSGLDSMSSNEEEDDADEENEDYEFDICTVSLLVHLVNESNVEKVKKFLDKIDDGNIQEFAGILCHSRLGSLEILQQLYRDEYLEDLLIYSLMLDKGRTMHVEWFTAFFDAEEINRILDSYSEELGDFSIPHAEDDPDVDYMLFIAFCRDEADDVIKALVRRAEFEHPLGAFFFMLVNGKSEELIRYFLTHQTGNWNIFYSDNIPSNVDIPHSLLSDIIPHFGGLIALKDLIPNAEKFIAALKYIQEHNLWSKRFTLLGVVRNEIQFRRPKVLQAVLDIATKDNLCSFALEPIFCETKVSVDMPMQRLPVMEYLNKIPLAKLVEVIHKTGPHSPEILDPTLDDPLNASMLPLIYRLVFASPRSFGRLMRCDYWLICKALIEEGWSNIFPDKPCPTNQIDLFPQSFFMLVREMERGNVKVSSIIYPVTLHAFLVICRQKLNITYPEDFTFRQKNMAKNVFQLAGPSISNSMLIKYMAVLKDMINSPFTEVVFKQLIRRPNGLALIIDAKIMDSHELVHLMRTFIPLKYVTADLVNAIQNGALNEQVCPWINTGLDTFN